MTAWHCAPACEAHQPKLDVLLISSSQNLAWASQLLFCCWIESLLIVCCVCSGMPEGWIARSGARSAAAAHSESGRKLCDAKLGRASKQVVLFVSCCSTGTSHAMCSVSLLQEAKELVTIYGTLRLHIQ